MILAKIIVKIICRALPHIGDLPKVYPTSCPTIGSHTPTTLNSISGRKLMGELSYLSRLFK